MFKTHYRLPLNFTDELFSEAKLIDEKLFNVLKQANLQIQLNNFECELIKQDSRINEIMDEDFNTPNLITYLQELIKELNNKLRAKAEFIDTYDKLMLIANILGLKYELPILTHTQKEMYQQWLEYRESKNFVEADKLREQLTIEGVL